MYLTGNYNDNEAMLRAHVFQFTSEKSISHGGYFEVSCPGFLLDYDLKCTGCRTAVFVGLIQAEIHAPCGP